MKILEWMQKKLNGSTGKKKSNPNSTTYYMMHEPCKQEFSDWPQALLVIGTFGNNNLIEDSDSIVNTTAGDSSSSQDTVQEEFTIEAAGNLQNELSMCLGEHQVESNWVTDQINQCLDSEGRENETFSDGYNSNGGSPNLCRNSSLVHRLDNSKGVNGKKSLVFLLKSMFVCRSGFPPTPGFEETESRILEKILREILHKKLLYPRVSRSAISMNKYQLEDRPHVPESDSEEEMIATDADNGSKWDKTDSEYIVLEI